MLRMPRDIIAKRLGVTEKALYRHLKPDIDDALAEANIEVMRAFHAQAKSKRNLKATIEWLQAYGGLIVAGPKEGNVDPAGIRLEIKGGLPDQEDDEPPPPIDPPPAPIDGDPGETPK